MYKLEKVYCYMFISHANIDDMNPYTQMPIMVEIIMVWHD